MTEQAKTSKGMNAALWTAQILLAASLLTGTALKFMPIEKVSAMMPWTGQIPVIYVRLLGVIDLLGAAGLILPMWLNIKPQLTKWAATGCTALMVCAIIFHVLRGEASVIGFNIFCIVLAVFIALKRK
ncbi:MAG TPA: DoxX family protein [Bacteroidia bacterium]|nr:DoxX family protein [Bacteroidia bacterium]